MHRTSYLAGLVWALLVIAAPGTVRAQDHAHGAHDHARSAYAGQEDRAIKALSPERIRGLLAGEGMGLAKAAELNGLPGPKHVLDLAEPLVLTDEQDRRIRAIRRRMHDEAVALGREIIAAERQLDRRLAARDADEAAVDSLLAGIGRLEGRLRAVHIRAHLAVARVLTPDQIVRYGELRGYAPASPSADAERPGR